MGVDAILIAYPTESCYGLGCDPRNLGALRRLIRLKGRRAAKGLLLIADHFKRLQPFVRPLSAAAWHACGAAGPAR